MPSPSPIARCTLTFAAAAVGLALAVAAPAHAQGAATPQAALDTLQAAIDKGDAAAAMGVLTPAGRKVFAKDMVVQTLAFLAFMDPSDPMPGGPKDTPAQLEKKKKAYGEAKTAIAAAFKPSGMDAAIGKPLMEAEPIVDKGLEKADLTDVTAKTLAAVAKAAPAFGKEAGPLKLPLKLGPFTNLKVDGATATVKSGPKTLKFEQTGGKWYLNAPLPEPPPQ
jgi:hypothetical protein